MILEFRDVKLGKYVLRKIWHTLFFREKLFLTAQVVLFHQAHGFGQQVLGSVRQEKRSLLKAGASAGVETLLALVSADLILYLFSLCSFLSSPFSPHTFIVFIHHHKCGNLFLTSCISFRLLLQLLQLVKTSENMHQLSLLPDLLLHSQSAVDMQCSVPFTFQCYCLFPDIWAFCLISSCLNSFYTSAITVHSVCHR